MSRKKLVTQLAIISAIFLLGFLIRIDSAYIPGVPVDEKSFYEDANGLPYMYELDSYYNYRLTENFINHGYMGDIKLTILIGIYILIILQEYLLIIHRLLFTYQLLLII